MKDLNYFKKLKYKWTGYYDPVDKVYFVEFPELPGCIAHGKTESKALKNALEVKDEWLETALEAGWTIPEPTPPVEASGRITFRPTKSIHQRLNERANEEGVSVNQLILTFVSEGLERTSSKQVIKETIREELNYFTSSVTNEIQKSRSIQQQELDWKTGVVKEFLPSRDLADKWSDESNAHAVSSSFVDQEELKESAHHQMFS